MKRLPIFTALLLLIAPAAVRAAEKPRLVVNIVVSQMRYDYLSRFGQGLGNEGFKKFLNEGTVFTDAYYNYAITTTPAALATLTTGATPSLHGVTSEHWVDYTNNRTVHLIYDEMTSGLDCDAHIGKYSPANIAVPTLGCRLREEDPLSRVVTIAADPVSAVVMGGGRSDTYWLDASRCNWISSTAYMSVLPEWVDHFNKVRYADNYLQYDWTLTNPRESYVNKEFSVLNFKVESHFKKLMTLEWAKKQYVSRDYPQILNTPAGNTLVKDFVKQAIIYEDLGKDEKTDVLNVCFDSPRYVGELFGPTSMEVEDMFYRLDADVADLVQFVFSHVGRDRVLITLTSDHGCSDAYDSNGTERDRFNVDQFKVIVNSFMNVQYGTGKWVVDFVDRQLYLDRNQIYTKNLSLEEVQNRVAAFILQFRGVSHVLTGTALTGSYFGSGYAQKMQNSFYPRRSGDVMINLMPGWIIEDSRVRSESGSMYDYDTHVPLMMLGSAIPHKKIRDVTDMTSLAPTLARIMNINRPIASEGVPVQSLTEIYE